MKLTTKKQRQIAFEMQKPKPKPERDEPLEPLPKPSRGVNRKAKGTRNEYKTVRLLESLGYYTIRAAGSHGFFDVVGLSKTDFVAVQVKSNRMPSAFEIEQMKSCDVPANCRKLIHVWTDGKTAPFVKEI